MWTRAVRLAAAAGWMLLAGAGGCESRTPGQRRAAAYVAQLRDQRPDRRIEAARALGELKHRPAVGPLGRLLYDIRPDVRLAAVVALGRIGDPAATEDLTKVLKAPEWNHRKAAAEALGSIADPRAVGALVEALADDDLAVGKAAARALGAIGGAAVGPLIAALSSGPQQGRPHAAHALGLIADPRAQAPLRDVLAKANAEARALSADVRAKQAAIPDAARIERTIDSLAKRLADLENSRLSPDRRRAAREKLEADIRSQRGALERARAARDEIAPLARRAASLQTVRLAASEALAGFKDPRDVPAMIELLSDPSANVRMGVREHLAAMGDPAVEALVEAAGDDRAEVRLAAVMTLIDIGDQPLTAAVKDQRAIEALLAAMDDPDAKVAEAAHRFFSTFPAGERLFDRRRFVGRGRPKLAVLGEIAPQLVKALAGGREAVRLRAVELLDPIAAPELVGVFLGALTDAHPPVKLRAIATLSRLGDPRAVEPLAALLKDPDEGVRFAAAEALSGLGDRRGVEAMIAFFAENLPKSEAARGEPVDFPTRELRARMHAAAVALGRSGDRRSLDALLPALKSRNVHFVAQVVQGLYELGDPRAFEPLLPILDFSDWHGQHPRGVAIRTVAKLGGRRAVQPLIRQLNRTAWQEPQQKGTICRALGRIGDPGAVDAITDYLTADLAENRTAARDALLDIGPAALPGLIARADTDDRTFREAVSMVLAKMGAPAVEAVVGALKHPSPRVRQAAAWALGQAPDRRSVEPLLDMMRAEADDDARVAAAWALGQLKDVSAVEALAHVLAKDPNQRCRRGAAEALGRIGDRRGVEPLLAALKDVEPAVRGMAAAALGGIGDARAIGPLEALVKGDNVVDVRAAANEALLTLRSTLGAGR